MITPEQEYEDMIPQECRFQTFKEHWEEMLLCAKHLHFPHENCDLCEFSAKGAKELKDLGLI